MAGIGSSEIAAVVGMDPRRSQLSLFLEKTGAIQPDDLSRVRDMARSRGFTLEGGRIAFGTGTPSERELYRISKASGAEALTLDLLLVGPSLASVWNQRKRTTWRDHELWVVSRDGLIHMKRLSGRLQDLADIEAITQSESGSPDE